MISGKADTVADMHEDALMEMLSMREERGWFPNLAGEMDGSNSESEQDDVPMDLEWNAAISSHAEGDQVSSHFLKHHKNARATTEREGSEVGICL